MHGTKYRPMNKVKSCCSFLESQKKSIIQHVSGLLEDGMRKGYHLIKMDN